MKTAPGLLTNIISLASFLNSSCIVHMLLCNCITDYFIGMRFIDNPVTFNILIQPSLHIRRSPNACKGVFNPNVPIFQSNGPVARKVKNFNENYNCA